MNETFQRTLLQTFLQLIVVPSQSSGTLFSAVLWEVPSLDVRGEGEGGDLAYQVEVGEAGTVSCFLEEEVEHFD